MKHLKAFQEMESQEEETFHRRLNAKKINYHSEKTGKFAMCSAVPILPRRPIHSENQQKATNDLRSHRMTKGVFTLPNIWR